MRIKQSFASFILIGISAVALTITSARASSLTPSFSNFSFGLVAIDTTSEIILGLTLELDPDHLIGTFTSDFEDANGDGEIPVTAVEMDPTGTGFFKQFLLTYVPTGIGGIAGLDFDFFKGGIDVFAFNELGQNALAFKPQYSVTLRGEPAPQLAVIPLPAALPLFLTGLAGLALIRRRRRQA